MTADNPDNPPSPDAAAAAGGDPAPRFVVDAALARFLSAAGEARAVDPADPGRRVTLDAEQSRHALRALRLSVGDAVQLLDGRGTVAAARIETTDGGAVGCAVGSARRVPPCAPRLTIATAIPKGPRGDALANDLAQLGADVLVPMRTERTVVLPRPAKLERYRRQAAEAAKQCGRAWFMGVAPLTPFAQVLHDHGETPLKLLADPHGGPTRAVAPRLAEVSEAIVLVGPEGGLTDAERAAALDAGFIAWRFAPHILRVEAAAAAAVAVLRALA